MISQMAVVQTDDIGENAEIKEFAVIREGVHIGNNVVIHPFVVIESGVTIGDNVEIFPGSYIGKIPKGAALARKPEYNKYVEIKANCSIGPNAVIYYDVEIGENTLIGDGASVRDKCRVGSNCLLSRYVTVNYATTIGDNTKIMDSTHITGKCRIGDNVFISTCVGTTNDNDIG
ncbi:MAG TPA: DapH/DapD/GlmU-related protein, partial [Syntrophomonadaceae bacterium]|nr:DapH/DapD/GlmU-related protein [Syntrophomonadaceae bacterium]